MTRRKLCMVVAGGAVAGAISAILATTVLGWSGASPVADGPSSSLLESADSSGSVALATYPAQPADTGAQGYNGAPITVVGGTRIGGGSTVHSVTPPAPQPQSGASGSTGSVPLVGAAPGASGSVTVQSPAGSSQPSSSGTGASVGATAGSSSTVTSTSTSTVTVTSAAPAASTSSHTTSTTTTSTQSSSTSRPRLVCLLGICL